MRYVLILSLFIFMPLTGEAITIHVPGDYPTIQQAIDASADGDTVLVAPDTYNENINFIGKAILVKSSGGPKATVIDGGQAARVVTFENSEGPDSIIQGFTLTNGQQNFGGGLMCYMADPTIKHNIISHNWGTPYYGGGIYCRGANPVITGNIFFENTADDKGGGIMCYVSSPVMTNNFFFNNKAFSGGGVHCEYNSGAVITNNTFYGNEAVSDGGGLFCTRSSSVLVANSIFWENSGLVGPEISIGDSSNPSTLDVSYTDIQGGKASIYVETGCTLIWGAGMIDLDPLFADPADRDLHLTHTSPCRDAGFIGAPALPPKDFEGDPRAAQQGPDMGADEFHTHLYYKGKASPGNTVEVKMVGWPTSTPVGLFIGSGVLDPPVGTIYGDWYLQWPIALIGPLWPIPADGFIVLSAIIPASPPPPYCLPMQALIGNDLTNLCVMHVQ